MTKTGAYNRAREGLRPFAGLFTAFQFEDACDRLAVDFLQAYEAGRKDENTRILACSVGTVRNDFYGPGEHPVIPFATFNDSPNALTLKGDTSEPMPGLEE